jgi:hypothetical protein
MQWLGSYIDESVSNSSNRKVKSAYEKEMKKLHMKLTDELLSWLTIQWVDLKKNDPEYAMQINKNIDEFTFTQAFLIDDDELAKFYYKATMERLFR